MSQASLAGDLRPHQHRSENGRDNTLTTFLSALKQCGKRQDLELGKVLHLDAVESGKTNNKYVSSALITMYSKCKRMKEARAVFDNMRHRDVAAWNSLILGYVVNGESLVALNLFASMNSEPDSVTYIAAFKACAALATANPSQRQMYLENGMSIHRQAREQGLDRDTYVASNLIDMYGKCGSMVHARGVFDGMARRDVVSWSSLILGYVENGESLVAIELFSIMDCVPDSFTFVAVLKACASLASERRQFCMEKVAGVHRQVRERGVLDVYIASALVSAYSKLGNMVQARAVFDTVNRRDVFLWTTLILGYVENGESLVGMQLFSQMDCRPTSVTFVAALKACTGLVTEERFDRQFCLVKGKDIHRRAKELRFDTVIFVGNTLVDMYSKCGSMRDARSVFEGMKHRDVVSWTSLMMGYVENGESLSAMELFTKMDCEPNQVTFVAVLKACSFLVTEKQLDKRSCLEKVLEIHKQARSLGFCVDLFLASTLLDVYSKCGSMWNAQEVFDKAMYRDVVMWNTLILGYVENGESLAGMELFMSMECTPDCATYVNVMKACGNLSSLSLGKCIHSQICKLGFEQDEVVATSLVDFYGKCGSMNNAETLFDSMHSHDIVIWNALLAGYSSLGDTPCVFSLVNSVLEGGLNIDGVTLVLVLTACSLGGMVEEGMKYFYRMPLYGIRQTYEHYTCVVDMLGKANKLEEALCIVKSIPNGADCVVWRSLLGACKTWNNLEVGKVAFGALVACNEKDGRAYVIMGDIYKKLGMQQEWEQIEAQRKATFQS